MAALVKKNSFQWSLKLPIMTIRLGHTLQYSLKENCILTTDCNLRTYSIINNSVKTVLPKRF